MIGQSKRLCILCNNEEYIQLFLKLLVEHFFFIFYFYLTVFLKLLIHLLYRRVNKFNVRQSAAWFITKKILSILYFFNLLCSKRNIFFFVVNHIVCKGILLSLIQTSIKIYRLVDYLYQEKLSPAPNADFIDNAFDKVFTYIDKRIKFINK